MSEFYYVIVDSNTQEVYSLEYTCFEKRLNPESFFFSKKDNAIEFLNGSKGSIVFKYRQCEVRKVCLKFV